MTEKVCLVIVTYNRCDILMGTLESIDLQSRKPDYVIIVDNLSTDNTLERLAQKPNLFKVIRMHDNIGYGAAAAEGMKFGLSIYYDIDYFWIMDDDSRPSPKTLDTLLNAFNSLRANDKIGILGLLGFKLKFGGYTRVGDEKIPDERILLHKPEVIDVDFVLMDGSLVKREVVEKCGVYRVDYFMIGEDYEYCKRVLYAGFKIGFLRSEDAILNRLILGGGGGFSRSNIWRGYYQARNHLHILRSYFSLKDMLSYVFRQAKFMVYSLLSKSRFERIYYRLLGIYHGLKGKTGKTIEPFS